MPNLNFVALSPDVPLVLTAHDLSFELYPSFFTPKERLWHRLVRPRELVRRAARILAVSKHTRNDLVQHYGASPERITVTYPGVHERFFKEPPDTPPSMGRSDEKANCFASDIATTGFPMRSVAGKPGAEPPKGGEGAGGGWHVTHTSLETVRARYELPGNFILFLGTLGERKNFVSAIEAFGLLKKDPQFADLHLVLAGKPTPALRLHSGLTFSPPPTGRGSKRGWDSNHIHSLGYVPSEDRPALYRLARAFVYPSYYEGFGFPPLEAMASGTPVVASHASSLGEVIGDAGILIDPYNIQDIRRALELVLTDQKLANTLGTRGRERARQFTWEKTARATLEVFNVIARNNVTKQPLLSSMA